MEIRISRRECLGWLAAGAYASGCRSLPGAALKKAGANKQIGYTVLRTNLPGGRFANIITMRAWMVQADGDSPQMLGEALVQEPCAWTQFAGWSPDGQSAIVGRGWEHPDNGAWEEAHRTFRFDASWLYDMYLINPGTGKVFNVTAVDRVSHYNTGLFYIAGDPPKLGFQALIDGNSHPFRMDLDGRNKEDLTSGNEGFTYGFSASPDGRYVSYHKDYQVFTGTSDGRETVKIETGNPFNFGPQWSPDGQWLLFLSGERIKCDPYAVRPDGSGLRRIASRQGYKGWIEFLDVYDFHEGSSDTPIWAADSRGIYYTALFGDTVELMHASLEGVVRRLTYSKPGVLHYHPKVSPDGQWMVFGSTRDGVRQLYIRPADPGADDGATYPLTHLAPGSAAMWAQWQP